MDYADGIDEFNLNFTFGEAHPGQSFEVINEAHFNLKFFKVGSHAGYIEAVTHASYLLTFLAAGTNQPNRITYITEASFTILTSRTNPLEPQPVIG
jgi:hypothetical protein